MVEHSVCTSVVNHLTKVVNHYTYDRPKQSVVDAIYASARRFEEHCERVVNSEAQVVIGVKAYLGHDSIRARASQSLTAIAKAELVPI